MTVGLMLLIGIFTLQNLGYRYPLRQVFLLEEKLPALSSTETNDRSRISDEPSRSRSTDLPDCRDIMRRPGSPYASGDFITRPTTPHTWIPRSDGSRQFELMAYCQLHRYTAVEARQCLADKSMLFVGDSLTRFQMLGLAYFLDKGTHPAHFERGRPNCTYFDSDGNPSCSPENEPNVCNANDFGPNWKPFHHSIGGALSGGVFEGRLECDCVRGGVKSCPEGQNGMCDTENFYYATPANEKDRVVMSFFFESGWGKVRGPYVALT